MKISLLQTDIRWKDPRANRRRAEELISDLPAADLIVLPEMFTTGFCTNRNGRTCRQRDSCLDAFRGGREERGRGR